MSARLEPSERRRKRLFDRQETVALDSIADFWPEVKAVAFALLQQETLSGAEVNCLIDPKIERRPAEL